MQGEFRRSSVPFIPPHKHGASGHARGQTKTHARGIAAHVQAATWIAERARRVRVRRAGGLLIGASEATVNAIVRSACTLFSFTEAVRLMKSKKCRSPRELAGGLLETFSQLHLSRDKLSVDHWDRDWHYWSYAGGRSQ